MSAEEAYAVTLTVDYGTATVVTEGSLTQREIDQIRSLLTADPAPDEADEDDE